MTAYSDDSMLEIELAAKVDQLQKRDEQINRLRDECEEHKREVSKVRLQHNAEKNNLRDKLLTREQSNDLLKEDMSDLRCKISVLEHKLEYETAKQTVQDATLSEITKLQEEISTLTERLAVNSHVQQAEVTRHQREHKEYEEHIGRLKAELAEERMPPTKKQLQGDFDAQLKEKNVLLYRAVQLCVRAGGPLAPVEMDKNEPVERFLREMSEFLAGPLGGRVSPRAGERRKISTTSSGLCDYNGLMSALNAVPVSTRMKLVQRFEDCCQANVASSRCFGETSGFPPKTEDSAVLVNHIANLTAEKEALLERLGEKDQEIERVKQGEKDFEDHLRATQQKEQPTVIKVMSPAGSPARTPRRQSPGQGVSACSPQRSPQRSGFTSRSVSGQ